MRPFKRTLSERYCKLVKLIKSIDSHFQLTEDKEDSLRLHLPNYKGNQPMDFHIYLLEPFLYISFTAEIDGEKVTCLSNYHQNIDQQDMFNDAMARNLNKVHEVLGKKYSEDTPKASSDVSEQIYSEIFTLNESQKKSLFYYACIIACDEYSRWHIEKAPQALKQYQSLLEISEQDAQNISSPNSYMSAPFRLKDFKSIKSNLILSHFFYTCVSFVDINLHKYVKDNFYNIIEVLGYTINDVKNIIRVVDTNKLSHFFDNKNLTDLSDSPKVIKTWPLLTFAKAHGKMQVGDFQNKETGEMFKACIFTQPDGTRVFVAFSSKLGALTPKEIAAMKDELVVVQLESGNYSLCKRDTNWEDVPL